MNTQEEKPMKLISMTAFVLEQEFAYGNEFITAEQFAKVVCRYANFLNHHLTLGMIVPVDEDGDIMENPNAFNEESEELDDYSKSYEEAKDKVLFEGFEFDNKEKLEDFSILKNGSVSLNYDFKYKTFELNRYYFENIDDLIDCNVFLTQTAKNKIFQ